MGGGRPANERTEGTEATGVLPFPPYSPCSPMAIRVVQLGTPRGADEGIRLGTVRRPPRGVKKTDFARLDYYDVWVPELAPSEPLRKWILSKPVTRARWAAFARRYRREMRAPAASRLIAVLAALSPHSQFSVGCYCDDESRCHRSVLRELFEEAGAITTVISVTAL
jgi:uncharacterized protein YeaO (DUF488 family)